MSPDEKDTYLTLSSKLLIADDNAYTAFDEKWLENLRDDSKAKMDEWNKHFMEKLHEHRRMGLVQVIVNMIEAKQDNPTIFCGIGGSSNYYDRNGQPETRALVTDIQKMKEILNIFEGLDAPLTFLYDEIFLENWEKLIDLTEITHARKKLIEPKLAESTEQGSNAGPIKKDRENALKALKRNDYFQKIFGHSGQDPTGRMIAIDEDKADIQTHFTTRLKSVKQYINDLEKKIEESNDEDETKKQGYEQELQVYKCILSEVEDEQTNEKHTTLEQKRVWGNKISLDFGHLFCGYSKKNEKFKEEIKTAQQARVGDIQNAVEQARKSYYNLADGYREVANEINAVMLKISTGDTKKAWKQLRDLARDPLS